ncbi:ABC transporter ATP-binding protein [Candidatus Parcubacteria bacterium]|nr:ABC transporter ATP-binding protein [Candidatus Parcubacteria bacterium]
MEIIQEFKIIWEYLRKYKKEVRRLAVLAIITSSITAVIPYIYGRLVDLVSIQTTELSFIFALLGIWLLMSIVTALFNRFVRLRGNFLATDAYNNLMCESSNHVMELPLKFHTEKKIGAIFSKIERAAMYLQTIISNVIFWIFPEFLTVSTGILILFFIEWKLAIGIIFLCLGFILITLYKTTPIIESQKKLNKTSEMVSGNLYDAFLNIQTIKSCAGENFQRQRTNKDYNQTLGPDFKDFFRAWSSLSLWQNFFFSLGFISVFGFALLLLRENLITPGKLVMCLGYLTILRHPLMNLAWLWQDFRTGITTIKRVRKLLEIKPENYNPDGKILEQVKGEIKFKDVSFGYKRNRLILADINLTALAGKKIAIVGGSGEGKTTLVDLISLYFIPTQGKILFDGVDTKKMNLSFLRSIIAYVPQEIILFNDTVKNNILYGKPNATDKEIIEATKAANAHGFIETFPKKYDQIVGERGIKLSTGQKQRLAIARAIIRDPKILILDEATSSLDMESERLVQGALEKLIKNRTTFIIAHRLSTVRNADKILVLEKGKIIEQGTHKELIRKKGAYFKFYSLQFKI